LILQEQEKKCSKARW